MELFKVISAGSVVVADELLKAELPPSPRRASEFSALDDSEMAQVGGGEAVVCW